MPERYNVLGSMLNPIPKTAIERGLDRSFFFRDDVERPEPPLLPMSKVIAAGLGPEERRTLGVTKIRDKRSGKMVWAWPAMRDYESKLIPGPPSALLRFTTDSPTSRGQELRGEALSYFGGVKADPIDKIENALRRAYDERQKLEKRRAALGQRSATRRRSTDRQRTDHRPAPTHLHAAPAAR